MLCSLEETYFAQNRRNKKCELKAQISQDLKEVEIFF